MLMTGGDGVVENSFGRSRPSLFRLSAREDLPSFRMLLDDRLLAAVSSNPCRIHFDE
jgi:hypothetical protein